MTARTPEFRGADSADLPEDAADRRTAPAPGVQMNGLEPLRQTTLSGVLRPLDLQFARWLGEVGGDPTDDRLLAAALASHRVGEGDVCLDLSALAGRAPFAELPALTAPPLAEWRESLSGWPVVGTPDIGATQAPLVLDGADRLYLGRYWHHEETVAQAIGARAALWSGDIDRARLSSGLDRLFPSTGDGDVDWQRVAAAMAVLKPLCVISGGPGTGKTRTVTAILALMVEQRIDSGAVPRVGLAAPTGKAAARLTESIRAAKAAFLTNGAIDDAVAAAIPEEAQTLHRLLGTRPGRVTPKHGPDNPLHLDLLVVDEASMLDLPLAARLLAALPPDCGLILLGDRNQLASVQAGAVLGDICGRDRVPVHSSSLTAALAETTGVRLSDNLEPGTQLGLDLAGVGQRAPAKGRTGLSDSIALLRRSYRFRAGGGIQALASAVNQGDGRAALAVLDAGQEDAGRLDLGAHLDQRQSEAALAAFIAGFVVPHHRAVLEATDPAAALRALGAYRVLCAVREGPFGLLNLNRLAERALAGAGLIPPEGGRYPGRPLLVTANDYDLKLYNGDVGLLLPDAQAGGELRAWFETADGLRRLSPHRLPPVETLYAMTVHKSQGSEFDEVALVLPRHDSRAVSRELIYTGITRARRRVTLVAAAERLIEGVSRRIQRSSGLHDALWGSE